MTVKFPSLQPISVGSFTASKGWASKNMAYEPAEPATAWDGLGMRWLNHEKTVCLLAKHHKHHMFDWQISYVWWLWHPYLCFMVKSLWLNPLCLKKKVFSRYLNRLYVVVCLHMNIKCYIPILWCLYKSIPLCCWYKFLTFIGTSNQGLRGESSPSELIPKFRWSNPGKKP